MAVHRGCVLAYPLCLTVIYSAALFFLFLPIAAPNPICSPVSRSANMVCFISYSSYSSWRQCRVLTGILRNSLQSSRLGNLAAVFFFPILMYICGLGIVGAAISTVASQYIVAILMLWHLSKKTSLLLPSMKNLQFGGYLKSGGFLLGRTLAAFLTVTLSTSMAARLGAIPMAAHQICLQVWLSVSLLVDAQAASGQVHGSLPGCCCLKCGHFLTRKTQLGHDLITEQETRLRRNGDGGREIEEVEFQCRISLLNFLGGLEANRLDSPLHIILSSINAGSEGLLLLDNLVLIMYLLIC